MISKMASPRMGETLLRAATQEGAVPLGLFLAVITTAGLLFQIGHFTEHAFQFIVWVLGDLSNICGRDTPWMSEWANALVRWIGFLLVPVGDPGWRMMLGLEVLHLIGNTIFLVALASLQHFVSDRRVRWAFYIEAFHLCEHILLTITVYTIGKPIGMSTLFGTAGTIGGREFAVGFRVSWHFAMNLLPMPLAMIGLMRHGFQPIAYTRP